MAKVHHGGPDEDTRVRRPSKQKREMAGNIIQGDEATHGGGKRDAEGQSSAENKLSETGPRDSPGPVRKRMPQKRVPKKPVTHSRSD